MRYRTSNLKAKMSGGKVVSSQQVAFELKQRVVFSLNKLADRDTNHLGVVELEKLASDLGPEGIAPFLSGVMETDADQKSAVRKECVRIMGVLARLHGSLLAPHLGKMVASIVKRLKDTDSVVRDACVDTVGIFASNVAGCRGESEGGAFIVLVRPLFEALGEQNRYVQAGAALCLARVIDDSSYPLIPFLQSMLNRVIKLMKNPHFMAKPALIELVRSIVQAGGATTEHALSAAITSLLDSLKNTDWTTRKSASAALDRIAVNATSALASLKPVCIHSLEGCRFDKVKPVRDAVLHALQSWKSLQGSDFTEISEAGSSTKENFSRECHPDASSVSDGGWMDTNSRKVAPASLLNANSSSSKNKRAPLNARKACPIYVQNHEHGIPNDWHIEISVPKTHAINLVDNKQVESEGSCAERTLETSNMIQGEEIIYEDDDNPECSSISDLISGCFETKHVAASNVCMNESGSGSVLSNIRETNCQGKNPESQFSALKVEGKNPKPAVAGTDSSCRNSCCFQSSNELAFIRKQLLEIESRQSSLLDLLQVFMGNSMDSLSMLQFKVQSLESAVDKITQSLFQTGNHPSISSSKLVKKIQNVTSSPRISMCSPRPSSDANCRQPSRLSVRSSDNWEETASPKTRTSSVTSVKEAAELWRDVKLNLTARPKSRVTQETSGNGPKNYAINRTRKVKETSVCNSSVRTSEGKNSFWKRIKDFICARDVESAYQEALCSGDDLVLIELMDRTGPVLDRLSDETTNEILCTLATHILDHRFIGSIIPWLQQVVDISGVREYNHLYLSTKVKRELLLSIKEAASVEYSSPMEREFLDQVAVKLRYLWCEDNARGSGKSRSHELLQSKRVSVCH